MEQTQRYITVVRHAMARDNLGESDFDRPLSEQGRLEISQSAAAIDKGIPCKPERILCSTAVRTTMTIMDLIDKTNGWPGHPIFQESLYHCPPRCLAEMIAAQPAVLKHLMIVGHNPSVSAFVTHCLGYKMALMPLGVVSIQAAGRGWADTLNNKGKLIFSRSVIQ